MIYLPSSNASVTTHVIQITVSSVSYWAGKTVSGKSLSADMLWDIVKSMCIMNHNAKGSFRKRVELLQFSIGNKIIFGIGLTTLVNIKKQTLTIIYLRKVYPKETN